MPKNTARVLRGLTLLAALCLILPTDAPAADFPRAQLDESERQFNRAYLHYLDRDYWQAMDYLDRALNANTYLVDYYLLDGLILHRTGDTAGARSALANYLEVRPMDRTAPRVVQALEEQDRLLRAALGARPLPVRWQLSRPDMQTELGLGFSRPFSVRGLGKANALGGALCLADTLGDRVYILPERGGRSLAAGRRREVVSVPMRRPVSAHPMGDGTFTLFGENGEVYFLDDLSATPLSLDLAGRVSSSIADAEWISGTEFAVADPIAREVAFYSLQALGLDSQPLVPSAAWVPPETEMLFEPVAVDSYADWLAVADRGNGRVYILNAATRLDFFYAEVPAARDVLWSPLGELFVLTERGDIFCLNVDFSGRTVVRGEPLWEGLEDIWALFPSPGGDVCCLDVAASRLYKAAMLPSQAVAQGFLGLYAPVLALEAENRESFLVDATLISPFVSYFHSSPMVVQSIWNDRSIRSAGFWQPSPKFDGLLLHRPLAAGQALPLNLRPSQAERSQDIVGALPSFWLLHRETLTNVVVDASIPFLMEDLVMLTGFCLMNGLELDLWARAMPPLALVRASALTGGKTILSLRDAVELTPPQSRLQIQIPLPQELSSSGYPSRSMLSVYVDIGLSQTRAWIPLWPDLTGR